MAFMNYFYQHTLEKTYNTITLTLMKFFFSFFHLTFSSFTELMSVDAKGQDIRFFPTVSFEILLFKYVYNLCSIVLMITKDINC
jgi:hypothetical protein